jgi:hypothetical protein
MGLMGASAYFEYGKQSLLAYDEIRQLVNKYKGLPTSFCPTHDKTQHMTKPKYYNPAICDSGKPLAAAIC